ncbi:hypothetical protein [Mesorhizobium sp. M4A.F.Ca.ET.050.02.1.1]|uniref:hypothetical protein n=1 Tax=Mesorhizobium sp. M4A.F.Ca.ET.050.02.1.1 TaxID=2496754 RepID=UPI001FDFFD1B|nr:hypothetical protein [Mesorhizobium sp. M4A.F.Ca.ET.050.02.1.1]
MLPASARSVSAMKEGRSSVASPKPASPAPNDFQPMADPVARPQPASGQDVRQRVGTVARLRRQRKGLVEDALIGAAAEFGIAPALIADQQFCFPAGNDDQQRLLEAGVVAAEIGDVGGMLAVAVDDEAIEAGLQAARNQRFDARLVSGAWNERHHRRLAEFRQRHGFQGNRRDRHEQTPPSACKYRECR